MAQFYPDGMREVNLNTATENNNGNFVTPPPEDFDTEAMRGSMQQILSENLGEFVVVEFLIGTQSIEQKQGILYSVGRSFISLYEEQSQTFVVCDIFSIKFVTFYLPGQRPGRPFSEDSELPSIQMPTPSNRGNMNGRGYRSVGNR